MGTKIKLIAWALCLLAFSRPCTAQEDNWTLLETTTFGAGGFWENNQTVRIDRSFKPNTFSYERKVTAGQSLSVFSSKGVFSALKKEYTPGETLSVTVSVSESGDMQAAPSQVYGRVTLLQGDPEWTRANWSSQKIAASGSVAGQLTSSGGSYLVTPAGFQELTLSGTIPMSGNRMAIIFSCNGMDVLHLYGRDGSEPETVAAPPTPEEKATTEPAQTADKVEKEQTAGQEAQPSVIEKPAREKKGLNLEFAPLDPKMKLLVLGVLLLLAVFDLLYMFSKPRK